MPMDVLVLPHQPKWAADFSSQAALIANALGSNAISIHHIGSTAIPAVVAKPIIDILVVVRKISQVDSKNSAMRQLGYECMGELGIAGRRYFRREDSAGRRTHNVHAFEEKSDHVRRHLAFRDFLNAHPQWAQRYTDLKTELVARFPDSMDDYIDGKHSFIQQIDELAARWNGIADNADVTDSDSRHSAASSSKG